MFKRFFGPEGRPEKQQFGRGAEGTGSGFVYDDKGHILTNNHVVAGSGKITVTFHDGVEASATIVGTDPDSDVAVIKVDNTSYRPLPKGSSSKLRVGELIMAVGSPFGLSQSVTTGIISATERNVVGINKYESFLQTDAAINPGNSGGPMVDMEGRVVGINSAIVTGSRGNDGVGFAIPIDMADTIAGKLIKDGKVSYARVGIKLGVLTPAIAKQFGLDPNTKGVVADEVLPGSPADKAGLKAGDVITSFNGKPVLSVPTFRLSVAASDVGKPFSMTYFREGKEQTTTITPAAATQVLFAQEREEAETPESAKAETPKAEIKDFGFEVQPLTPELAGQFGLDKETKGLLISSVKEGSPAEAAGLEEGSVITKVVQDRQAQAGPGTQGVPGAGRQVGRAHLPRAVEGRLPVRDLVQGQGQLIGRSNPTPIGRRATRSKNHGVGPGNLPGPTPALLRSINDPSRPIAREACQGGDVEVGESSWW